MATTPTTNLSTTEATRTAEGPLRYRDCTIKRRWVTTRGTPQPDEWGWGHDDYDGAEDSGDHRYGCAIDLTTCLRDIDECLDDV